MGVVGVGVCNSAPDPREEVALKVLLKTTGWKHDRGTIVKARKLHFVGLLTGLS